MATKTDIPVNPELKKNENKYNRIEILLEQDEEKIREEFCIKLPNEDNNGYEERKKTFDKTFINPVQDLVTSPVNSVFRQGYSLEVDNENSLLNDFLKDVTQGNDDVIPYRQYLKDYIGPSIRAYGTVFVVVDKPRNVPLNKEDEKNNGLPYLSTLRPQDVISWQFKDGKLLWFAYRKLIEEVWEDPFMEEKPGSIPAEVLWTQTQMVIRKEDDGEIIEVFDHNWGVVPVIIQASFLNRPSDIIGNSAMMESSNAIIIMGNLLNQGVFELQKHGSALLLMPESATSASNLETEDNGAVLTKRHDRGTMLQFDGETPPSYLVKELEVDRLLSWAEMYGKRAVENERDLKSVAKKGSDGSDVQESGFAKVISREPYETSLIALSEDLESSTNKILFVVDTMLAEKNEWKNEFDKDYDLRTKKQKLEEIKIAIDAGVWKVSETLIKEMWKNYTVEEIRDEKLQEAVFTEIDEAEADILDEKLIAEMTDKNFQKKEGEN